VIRRAPQQHRSERRLARFLAVAADLIVEVGYDRCTMTVIARRSRASIGALYHYFPDKASIAAALLEQYRGEIEGHLQPLLDRVGALPYEAFAHAFFEQITAFLEQRPAYLKLIDAPVRFPRAPAAKQALRAAFAAAFRAKNPRLPEDRALLAAKIALALAGDLTRLYSEAVPQEKAAVSAEFKKILTLYLAEVLSARASEGY
jgi:AcrR family transcriptional regulator